MNSSARKNGRCPLPESRLLWPRDGSTGSDGATIPPLPENEKIIFFVFFSLSLLESEAGSRSNSDHLERGILFPKRRRRSNVIIPALFPSSSSKEKEEGDEIIRVEGERMMQKNGGKRNAFFLFFLEKPPFLPPPPIFWFF